MGTFDKREEGFESKFAHDEEIRFKAQARRDKQLALWAAAKLGKTGEATDAYVKEIVATGLSQLGDQGILGKIRQDCDAGGLALSERQIRQKMDELMEVILDEAKRTG